jgi:hypothetical protein
VDSFTNNSLDGKAAIVYLGRYVVNYTAILHIGGGITFKLQC